MRRRRVFAQVAVQLEGSNLIQSDMALLGSNTSSWTLKIRGKTMGKTLFELILLAADSSKTATSSLLFLRFHVLRGFETCIEL